MRNGDASPAPNLQCIFNEAATGAEQIKSLFFVMLIIMIEKRKRIIYMLLV